MAQRSARQLQLVDLMIVVVAAAAATGWTRDYFMEYVPVVLEFPASLMTGLSKAAHLLGIVVPSLVWGSVASLLIALRPLRSASRRLACRPGVVATGIASMVYALMAASVLVGRSLRPWFWVRTNTKTAYSDWISVTGSSASLATGMAILSAWIVMRCGGRWRAESHWIDRLGRLLGFCWIANLAVELVVLYAMG